MQEETPTDWAETSTSKIVKGTRPHTTITNTNGQNNNFYNTLYRSQHVDKQKKDVINGELQVGITRVPNQASVKLNKDVNLEKLEHCSARVLIQPCVHSVLPNSSPIH